MNPKLLLIKFIFLLMLITTLQSCITDKPGIYKNDQIRQGKRGDFHELNKQLFKGLAANDVKQLEGIMSQDFISNNYKYRIVELISNRFKESSYTILDEYYLYNEKRGNHTINAGDHIINYVATNEEMYLAFFIPKTGANKFMITAVYCKLDYGWKLAGLDLNPYTENGLTAPQLIKKAKEDQAKGYLINADEALEQARDCMRPYEGWKFPIESEWGQLDSKIIAETKKKFRNPITLKQVATQPRIFSIDNQRKPDGVFPMIYYLTDIKLSDTNAVKKENLNIQKVIGKVIPGIDKDNKCILFAAYNEWPESQRSVDRYEMTDKLR